MYRASILAVCLMTGGCGFIASSIIKTDSLAFSDVIEDATNKLLVINVLRARDKAPLHFADIPVIRESMQQSTSISAIDFSGPLLGTTSRNNRGGVLGFQFTPSFEVTHLHSKEFHTGMATPIDPKFVKYWLDRGLDRRMVLLLFFSAAEIIETRAGGGPVTTIRIMNSPRDAADIITRRKQAFAGPPGVQCDTQSDFERYLKLINGLRTFFAHSYRERRLLASGLNLEAEKDSRGLQSFAALDQNKIQLVLDKGTRAYNVYAVSPEPKVAFCLSEPADQRKAQSDFELISGGTSTAGGKQSCFRPVVDVPAEDLTQPASAESPLPFGGGAAVSQPTRYCGIYNRFTGVQTAEKTGDYPRLELRLHLRSVGEIFQFLGDLVYYQDEIKAFLDRSTPGTFKLNTPVTFGFCGDEPSPGCDDIFMRLDGGDCDARFSLTYRQRDYHVANYNSDRESACGRGAAPGKDHTLEILSVLHQLVGLHRSGADIRQTPTVQVLP